MTLHSTQLEERVMRQPLGCNSSIIFRRPHQFYAILHWKFPRYIERIVDGLLSIVATMRVLPVIRCPPGDAAEMIALRLEAGEVCGAVDKKLGC